MYLGQTVAKNGEDIANLFASHFSSVFSAKCNDKKSLDYPISIDLKSLNISRYEIFSKLNSIKLNKPHGPDMIPSYLLKECCYMMTEALSILFNLSLSQNVFPEKWKISYVSPIFKNGDKTDIAQYRPVTIMSQIPKIFEDIITDKISPLFKNIIIEEQHGFVTGRSTSTNLMVYHQFVVDALANHSQVDCIYTDFTKAFDSVDHSILLSKLSGYGIRDPLLSWFASYLQGRTQRVKIQNHLSKPYNVSSGVPQGAHLAPLMFLIYINDIKGVFRNSKFLMFADDIKFFHSIQSDNDCLKLQEDLKCLEDYCSRNKLNLNQTKCKIISFSKKKNNIFFNYTFTNQSPVLYVDQVDDLGVLFNNKFTFNEHIDKICKKALQRLGCVTRYSREFSNPLTYKHLYVSLVRPLLEYCTQIWNPHYCSLIFRIESVQHKFIQRFSYRVGIPYDCINYKEMERSLNIQSLAERREIFDIIFLYKLLHSTISCSELLKKINIHVPPKNTRFHQSFVTDWQRTNYSFNSPLQRLMRSANKLNFDIYDCTYSQLKRNINNVKWNL